MDKTKKSILVISATGTQGRAVTRLLLKEGFPVRILVRNPNSAVAQELIKAGAQASQGDLSDPKSIEAALHGINAVYSILPVAFGDDDLELTGGLALINAARKAGVEQFVHASVASAGTHESFPRWGTGCWNEKYWIVKWQIEEAIHKAGFPYWTILKPVPFMENLLAPVRNIIFPQFKEGKLVTAQKSGRKWNWVTVEDTAKFVYAVLTDPEKFNKQNIEIASDSLTHEEASQVMTKVFGRKFEFISMSPEKAIENGVHPFAVKSAELCNETNVHHVDFEILKQYGIPLTSLEKWLTEHLDQFQDVVNA